MGTISHATTLAGSARVRCASLLVSRIVCDRELSTLSNDHLAVEKPKSETSYD